MGDETNSKVSLGNSLEASSVYSQEIISSGDIGALLHISRLMWFAVTVLRGRGKHSLGESAD